MSARDDYELDLKRLGVSLPAGQRIHRWTSLIRLNFLAQGNVIGVGAKVHQDSVFNPGFGIQVTPGMGVEVSPLSRIQYSDQDGKGYLTIEAPHLVWNNDPTNTPPPVIGGILQPLIAHPGWTDRTGSFAMSSTPQVTAIMVASYSRIAFTWDDLALATSAKQSSAAINLVLRHEVDVANNDGALAHSLQTDSMSYIRLFYYGT